MKKLILSISGALLLGGGALWLNATSSALSSAPVPQSGPSPFQSIDWIRADPSTVNVNQPTLVTVTAKAGEDATLLPDSANLFRYNEQGELVESLGRMYDDGTHGDALAGDYIFTTQFTLNEPEPIPVFLRATVAYRGLLRRVSSDLASVYVQRVITPEQTLSDLANELEAGNIEAALRRFSPSPLNRRALEGMDSIERTQFAADLRNARLVSSIDDLRIYQVPYVDREDGRIETEFSLARTALGEWVIISW